VERSGRERLHDFSTCPRGSRTKGARGSALFSPAKRGLCDGLTPLALASSLLGFCFLCQVKSHLNRCIDISPPVKGGEDHLVTTDSHEGRPVPPVGAARRKGREAIGEYLPGIYILPADKLSVFALISESCPRYHNDMARGVSGPA
jgi:hypothetical protein